MLGAVYERDDINEPISAEVHISSGYAELQSQFGEHWYSAANVRYDDNSRFGSKVTYRFAPTWVNAADRHQAEGLGRHAASRPRP